MRANRLSNGVDMDYFVDPPSTAPPSGVCFVGKMDYTPNVDGGRRFAHAILPRIRERMPDFRFVVIGGHPTEAVKALSADRGITVMGYEHDVRPHMRKCGLIVLPMRMGVTGTNCCRHWRWEYRQSQQALSSEALQRWQIVICLSEIRLKNWAYRTTGAR